LAWDEVSKLLEEGLLGEDEFEELWKRTAKRPGSDDRLDVYGFLSFNVGLDGLFDFDDEEMEDGEVTMEDDSGVAVPPAALEVAAPAAPSGPSSKETLVRGEGLSPQELFRKLTDGTKGGKLSREDVLRWDFLSDAVAVGDLSQDELDAAFSKASKGKRALDQSRFVTFYKAIDDLFEDDDGGDDSDGADDDRGGGANESGDAVSDSLTLKQELLDLLDDFNDPDLLPCGLDCSEAEQREILKVVSDLERQPSNMIRASGGAIDTRDLTVEDIITSTFLFLKPITS
jgi:hypothetical protein